MSTDTKSPTDGETPTEEELLARIEELEDAVATLDAGAAADAETAADSETAADADATSDESGHDQGKMTIVATKGTFDMAYPPLILASTAAAFGWEVVVFHTFWGLDILHEERASDLKLSAVGNPNVPVPNAIATLPGMDWMTTRMMRKRVDENGTATIEELIETAIEQGVDLQACQMTIDLMEYDEDDFIDGVTVGVGAATALQHMADSDVQLLV